LDGRLPGSSSITASADRRGRKERPKLDALLKGVARKDFDVVAAWSVDRLGRSLIDLIGLLQELHETGTDLYLHQQGINTTTPAGRRSSR
jgi:DNA invertase Pin-like site-specific DNA recombinase